MSEITFIRSPMLDRWARWAQRSGVARPIRLSVLERDGEHCTYCGSDEGPFHVDHIVPRSRGGTDDEENLTVACQTCNLSKGDKTLEEWRP